MMKELRRKFRRIIQGIALAFFGLFAGFVLIESVLRIGFARQFQTDATYTIVDPKVGWRNRPGWNGEFVIEGKLVPVTLNQQGIRGTRPVSFHKSPGVKRILCLGDSMTAGFEVPEEKTFASHLEKLLNNGSGPHVEVINAGVRGYGTDQCELWLRYYGMRYQPDIVLYTFSHNDLADNLIRDNKPYYTLKGSDLEFHAGEVSKLRLKEFRRNLYLSRVLRRLRKRRAPQRAKRIAGREISSERLARYSEWLRQIRAMDMNSTEWQLISHLLQRMNNLCKDRGAKFYVTQVVGQAEIDGALLKAIAGNLKIPAEDPYQIRERLKEICAREKIGYIDPFPSFAQHFRENPENLWWRADNHYCDKGHALAAQVLYRAFAREPLLTALQMQR